MNGIATQPEMPTIAGSDATYLFRQLEAYRSGERKNDMMSAVAPMLDEQKKAQAKREAQALAETQELAKLLESKPVAVRAKAGGNGKLFGTVTNADIADAISQSFSVAVDKHKIEVKNTIKALGTYPVEIRLGKNIVAKTTVSVVAA